MRGTRCNGHVRTRSGERRMPNRSASKNVVWTDAVGNIRANSMAHCSAPPSATKKSWTTAALTAPPRGWSGRQRTASPGCGTLESWLEDALPHDARGTMTDPIVTLRPRVPDSRTLVAAGAAALGLIAALAFPLVGEDLTLVPVAIGWATALALLPFPMADRLLAMSLIGTLP